MTRSLASPPARFPLGLRYMAGAAFIFAMMSLLVKVAGQRIPTQEIVMTRAIFMFVVTHWALGLAGISRRGNNRKLLVWRSLLGYGGMSTFFFTIIHMPLAEATLIKFTAPVFTTILAAWFLRERIGLREALSVATSLIGVLFIARPDFLFGGDSVRLDPLVVAVAVAGAIITAGVFVSLRKLGETDHHLVIIYYFSGITCLCSLPAVAVQGVWPVGWDWLVLLGVGITTLIGQVFMTRGLALEPAGRATAVSYLQIVFAGAWGAVFFLEFPDGWVVAGSILIVGSILGLRRPAVPRV